MSHALDLPALDTQRLRPVRDRLQRFLETTVEHLDLDDQGRVRQAVAWMVELHHDQKDRPDGQPYLSHTTEVAELVQRWVSEPDADLLIAALLHDSVEDQAEGLVRRGSSTRGTTRDQALVAVEAAFGARVLELLAGLTNPRTPPDMDRARRNELYVEHVAEAVHGDPGVATIKLADFSTNGLRLHRVEDDAFHQHLVRKYRPVVRVFLDYVADVEPRHPLYERHTELLGELREAWEQDYADGA